MQSCDNVMKTLAITKSCLAGCLVVLLSVHTALAGDKPDKSKKSAESQKTKEPWVDVKISSSEQTIIKEYVRGFEKPGKSGKKHGGLPPGLQKKVERGGSLPPGWQKKMKRGEVMPAEVFEVCHPLPPELVVKLPPPPQGVITVTVSGKVVRLIEATREILDVFEVGR